MLATTIISIVLAAICIFAVISYSKKLKTGGGCCPTHEAAIKPIKVKDKNKSHYPHTTTLRISGMTCGNCATRVANALNSMEDTWACDVNFGDGTATVLTKQQPSIADMRQVVANAGYIVLGTAN